MRVLFIGGTGQISTACSELCANRGMDLWLLNRGNHVERIPPETNFMPTDINDVDTVKRMMSQSNWDCVVDWTIMAPDAAERDIQLFSGRTKQFIYISSTAVYQPPPIGHRICENDLTIGPRRWELAKYKQQAEWILLEAYQKDKFPVTIVRPGHTCSDFTISTNIIGLGYGLIQRMKESQQIIVHDDGMSLWTLIHNSDFATGLVGLIGREDVIGETFHIAGDEVITWLDLFYLYSKGLGIEPKFRFIPSTRIYQIDNEIGLSLLEDRALDKIFDNSKIRRFVTDYHPKVTISDAITKSLKWHRENQDKIYYSREAAEAVNKIIQEQKKGLSKNGHRNTAVHRPIQLGK